MKITDGGSQEGQTRQSTSKSLKPKPSAQERESEQTTETSESEEDLEEPHDPEDQASSRPVYKDPPQPLEIRGGIIIKNNKKQGNTKDIAIREAARKELEILEPINMFGVPNEAIRNYYEHNVRYHTGSTVQEMLGRRITLRIPEGQIPMELGPLFGNNETYGFSKGLSWKLTAPLEEISEEKIYEQNLERLRILRDQSIQSTTKDDGAGVSETPKGLTKSGTSQTIKKKLLTKTRTKDSERSSMDIDGESERSCTSKNSKSSRLSKSNKTSKLSEMESSIQGYSDSSYYLKKKRRQEASRILATSTGKQLLKKREQKRRSRTRRQTSSESRSTSRSDDSLERAYSRKRSSEKSGCRDKKERNSPKSVKWNERTHTASDRKEKFGRKSRETRSGSSKPRDKRDGSPSSPSSPSDRDEGRRSDRDRGKKEPERNSKRRGSPSDSEDRDKDRDRDRRRREYSHRDKSPSRSRRSKSFDRKSYRDSRSNYASDSSNDEFDLSLQKRKKCRDGRNNYETVKMLRQSGLTYSGKRQEIALEFLKELRDFILDNQMEEEDVLGNLNQILKEDALVWFRAEKNFTKMNTFVKFAKNFRKQFMITMDDDDVYDELRCRTQGEGESIANYLKACKIIAANFREPLSQKRLVNIVRRHLLVDYQKHIIHEKNIKSLEELRDLCQDYEREKEYQKRYQPPRSKDKMRFPSAAYEQQGSSRGSRPPQKEKIGALTDLAHPGKPMVKINATPTVAAKYSEVTKAEGPDKESVGRQETATNTERREFKGTCRCCDQQGHMSRYCPHRGDKLCCYSCGEVGTTSRKCENIRCVERREKYAQENAKREEKTSSAPSPNQ